ncbi:Na+/H+ antiporter NhaC [Virgibacillus pantothenticus]|uniref:Sodium:proton antiporter n=1 Tax=Virgibacillus pantothenticus TaxID=1473 RepID=A0A0L0QUS4_VIRPA|nr:MULTISPECIES: Na+/H+ antiporter NhaC [Virgibacillus]API92654.1 Na+/H+ antiporter NhaC [Virgibacillus sp. 6R]KNE22430.1 sodium:proton antiporter [Virgibacillus pantothenticus]MBS7428147.1 Na+/H+ antiporter NhaC [Virgibacillus sp. 19R1-5]MBU8565342.1 Na+/H+ antiporter NhaC [Virgibacillus pantothenticus]MBU8599438.1 Na+/H+ antiporter NhaC [Virgibacillus pantothenticus]
MYRIKAVQATPLWEAIMMTVFIVCIISASIIFLEAAPHIPLILSLLTLCIYGLAKGNSYKVLEQGIVEGAKSGMGAIFIFFFIGILIAAWMMGGTIPTLMYAGFGLVAPSFYFAIVFVVTALIGVVVGSSLTTIATVGVAFIGVSGAVDVSLAITAGAIVSGAFFGDKMSPLSDTTNMASSTLQVDLFAHIKNMMGTTVPAFLISLLIFLIISPNLTEANFGKMNEFQSGLLDTGLVHWANGVIPLLVLLVLSVKKVPAILTLTGGSLAAIVMAYFHSAPSIGNLFAILMDGFVSETGVEGIDSLLTRGGINGMLFTISLVLLALSMGGLLFTLGIIPRLLASIDHLLNKVFSVILASATTAIGINVLIGEQYLSILLTGETYQSRYARVGLSNKNLSRVAEDAGTVINPLVPWSVCGVFITSVLGVSTLAYLPFAFFCVLSPLLTVLYGYTGWTLTYKKPEVGANSSEATGT